MGCGEWKWFSNYSKLLKPVKCLFFETIEGFKNLITFIFFFNFILPSNFRVLYILSLFYIGIIDDFKFLLTPSHFLINSQSSPTL